MAKRVAIVIGLVAGLWTLAGQAQVFRSAVDLVSLGVTVTDRDGRFVTDLTADDFTITEDGSGQAIRLFLRGDAKPAPELHLGLLFDSSGSMEEDISLSRSAAIKFLNALPDAVDVTLVDFDTEVRVARYGPADFPRLVERIRRRKPDGNTAMHDAMGVYLDGAAGQEGRKIFLLYTDGLDTSSSMSFPETLDLLRGSDVTMYAVGFLRSLTGARSMEQRIRLQQMTEATGGLAFFPTSAKDLDPAYEKVVADIRAQYTIGYLSTNTKTDGSWRKVEIKVTRPGLKVRSRKGHFAPFRQQP
ncbi:MAG: VWA domain-containing protein [Vicinamibacterales bacterium]|nr:VWA domain-containing protein [Vicinamibacterales bacterium]